MHRPVIWTFSTIQKPLQPLCNTSPGTMAGLKGGILTMALLDATGTLLPPSYEPWYDPNASDEEKEKSRRRRPASPPSSQEGQDSQFAVLCSEKQAKVLAMPSQTRIYKHNITETSFVLRADVVQMAGANCIACFCANGHIMTLRYHFNSFKGKRGGGYLPSPAVHSLFCLLPVYPVWGLCWTSTTCRWQICASPERSASRTWVRPSTSPLPPRSRGSPTARRPAITFRSDGVRVCVF